MTECNSDLSFNFYQKRPLVVQFSKLDLSSDLGVLLARQADEQLQICQGLAECIDEWRDENKVIHPLPQLVSQLHREMIKRRFLV
jgi:hypothetical protein